jgi:hypothetical protein
MPCKNKKTDYRVAELKKKSASEKRKLKQLKKKNKWSF